jgi:hypothetical protein
MFPEAIRKLRSGSLESVRERFEDRFPGEKVIATFARHVISQRDDLFFQRVLTEQFEFGPEELVQRSGVGDSMLETRGLAERIVDAALAGRDSPDDMDALFERVMAGHGFSAGTVKESVIGVLTSANEWRTFYRQYEPRIRKVLHGELGILEDRRLKPKYRKIRLGEFDEEDKATAVSSVRMSIRTALARLTELRSSMVEMTISEAPKGRMDLEQDLARLKGLKRVLEDELVRMSDYISGVDVTTENVSDAAATYDLVADEIGRYEVMASFIRRATSVASAT